MVARGAARQASPSDASTPSRCILPLLPHPHLALVAPHGHEGAAHCVGVDVEHAAGQQAIQSTHVGVSEWVGMSGEWVG